MKKLTALFLAFVLALSLPLIFATNEFDTPDHDHDHDHELLRVNDPWCDVCGNYTTQYESQLGSDICTYYDEETHLVYQLYASYCNTCGNVLNVWDTDFLAGHSFDFYYFDNHGGYEHRVCTSCGYDEIYDYSGLNYTELD